MPTQAVYGFCQMLLKVMREKRPDYLCVVFDPPGPTHRHDMYTAYKATRQKMPEELVVQVPYIKDLVRYHGVAQLEREGFEADDVIATLTHWAADHHLEVVIVSGDKDLIQLVNDPLVRQWDPQKDRVFTETSVTEWFGIAPDQMIDYLALVGDTSDNIPGVKGVGEKTARQLLQNWKSLHEIYSHIDEISPGSLKAKLLANQNTAYLSRILVTLKNDMPLLAHPEDFVPKSPQKSDLLKLYGELDFKKLLEALRQEWSTIEETAPSESSDSSVQIKIITDQKAFAELIGLLDGHQKFALHLDSPSSDAMRTTLRGIAISFEGHAAFYVPLVPPDESAQTLPSVHHVLDALKPFLGRSEIGKIGHDLKRDWIVLKQHGIQLEGIAFDTMVAGYLLNPGQNTHNLARLAGEHLGEATSMPPLSATRKSNQQASASLDPTQATATREVRAKSQEPNPPSLLDTVPTAGPACESADRIWRLAPMLESKLREAGQEQLFSSLELPLIRILSGMEYRGILVDAGKLESLAIDFEKAMHQKAKTIYELAKEEFNIQSPKQLAVILFEKLGLPVVKKMKSGPSTDSSVLEELAAAHPIAEQILSYRTLAKLKGTYADVLPRLIHPETGRIHTSFNQAITATGRLSSSEPNLQNIPIRSEEGRKIREAFVPSPGHVFLSADYSQIELRILAHFSKDEHLLEAFHSDGDVHRQTAAEMYNIPQHEVTPEMRRQAKTINFGIIYGMGAFGLARRLGISRQMARGVIEQYFQRYQGVKHYIDLVVEAARKLGYTETLLGRRRSIPELSSRNLTVRQQGERLAINSPIQGSAADLIKKAMIDVGDALEKQGVAATMVLQVHDELVFEVRKGELEAAKELILKNMEQVWKLSVPVKVDLGWGENWAKAHS
jgi:DNA polymerase I